jgi:phenylacetate-CoA ligase
LYTFRLASSFNMDSLLAYMVTPLDDILHAQTSQTDAVTTEPTGALDQATALFQTAARDVPAYRALIAEHGIKDAAGLSFKEAPYATKDNYFNKHPLESRCYGGSLSSADFVHQSSGSSGKPTYWLRSLADEVAVTARFEQVRLAASGSASCSSAPAWQCR